MKKPPKWQYPNAAERQYAADIKRMIADIRKLAAEELYKALPRMIDDARRTDAWPEDLDAIMQRLLVFGRSRANQVVMRLPQHAERMDSFNRRQWNKIAEATIGVNAVKSAPGISTAIRGWAVENALLIKSIPEQMLTQVAVVTAKGVQQGMSIRDLQRDISERFGVSDSRAELIARTETGKLNSQMTQERMRSAGVDSYIWRTASDERVRPEHAGMEGKKFKWSEPPTTGHPGEDFQCRCYAEPVFDDFE